MPTTTRRCAAPLRCGFADARSRDTAGIWSRKLTHDLSASARAFHKRRSVGLLSSLSTLRVDVLFETATGDVASLNIGSVLGNANRRPTPPMAVVANLLPREMTPVQFRFTARGGAWSVDDVWVDPYSRK